MTTLTACQPVIVYAQAALTWWVETIQAHTGEGNSGFVKASTALGVAKWTALLDVCVWGTAHDHT